MDANVYDILETMDAEVRFHEIVKDGQAAPQGDILLTRISDLQTGRAELEKQMKARWGDTFVLSPVGLKTDDLQLIQGRSTGSRHCIREEDRGVVEVYAPTWATATLLEGPVIVASDRFVVAHPDHAHHSLPAGIYQVTYQMDFAQGSLQRSQD